jgi:hypothetical protein
MTAFSLLKPIAAALILTSLAATATAEVYTWKDANGRVHFSDQPPPNVEVKPTRPAAGPRYAPATPADTASAQSGPAATAAVQSEPNSNVPAAQSGPKTALEKELELKQRRAAEQEAETKRKDEQARAEEKKRYCDGLRNNITMLERGGRVTQTNAKGEREFLDDAQMKQEADRARAQMARDCK